MYNRFYIVIYLFITSFAYHRSMLKRSLRLPVRYLQSAVKMSTEKGIPTAICDHDAITLVDFRLPAKETEVIQNLVNDEIISSAIVGGASKKLYICLHKPETASTTQVLNYISKLYSKVWNEAAMKNIFDIQCCVVSDSLEGLISRNEILKLKNLTRVMTFDTNSSLELNNMRKLNNLLPVNVSDVNLTSHDLFIEYNKQPNIIVLDSYYEEQLQNVPMYDHVALGGTFDNMHYGHCKLLTLASLCCKKILTIGITGDIMLSMKSNANLISNFSTRHNSVESFIKSIKPILELRLPELSDPFGPAITDPTIQAIVVSSETIRGAFKINSIRIERGFLPLAILVTYRTDSVVLSSTFIREKKQLRLK